jgi:general nucleoside transport system permease protein
MTDLESPTDPVGDDAGDGAGPAPASGVKDSVRRIVNPDNANLGFQRALVTAVSSVGAVMLALVICGVLLAVTGKDPFEAYGKILETGLTPNKLLEMVNRATPIMIAAVAVAIGFKMNLFNIGVEGQFLIGMFTAAVAGAYIELPPVLHVTYCILVGALGGMLWAAIPAVLKVKRGVNEVIATIMLNSIALAVIDWLFQEFFRWDAGTGALDVKTKPLPESAWMPDLIAGKLNAFFLVALAVVFTFWVVVFKSRFGFRLRASGLNAGAARTAGISSQRMIVTAMLMSGAVAGMVGLQSLLGNVHAYGTTRPDGFGFKGIAVALLGRNHPVGIVIAALLFGFLDAVAGPLQVAKIPQSIVLVIQAVTLLTVVIVNEVVSRWMDRRTAERAARALVSAEVAA